MKILILYHSGAGNTKLLSEIIFERINKEFEVEIISGSRAGILQLKILFGDRL